MPIDHRRPGPTLRAPSNLPLIGENCDDDTAADTYFCRPLLAQGARAAVVALLSLSASGLAGRFTRLLFSDAFARRRIDSFRIASILRRQAHQGLSSTQRRVSKPSFVKTRD